MLLICLHFFLFCQTLLHSRPAFLQRTHDELFFSVLCESNISSKGTLAESDILKILCDTISFKYVFWCQISIYKPKKNDLYINVHHIVYIIGKIILNIKMIITSLH